MRWDLEWAVKSETTTQIQRGRQTIRAEKHVADDAKSWENPELETNDIDVLDDNLIYYHLPPLLDMSLASAQRQKRGPTVLVRKTQDFLSNIFRLTNDPPGYRQQRTALEQTSLSSRRTTTSKHQTHQRRQCPPVCQRNPVRSTTRTTKTRQPRKNTIRSTSTRSQAIRPNSATTCTTAIVKTVGEARLDPRDRRVGR